MDDPQNPPNPPSSRLGLGAMIHMLGGNEESVAAYRASIGKTIERVSLDGDLRIQFADGSVLMVSDEGQSCCEHRYMTSDDQPTFPYYVGAKLLGIEVRDGPERSDDCGEVHETQFLDVTTDRGLFQCCTHNEHNGYYGGFSIECRCTPPTVPPPPPPVVPDGEEI